MIASGRECRYEGAGGYDEEFVEVCEAGGDGVYGCFAECELILNTSSSYGMKNGFKRTWKFNLLSLYHLTILRTIVIRPRIC